jgi:phage major head subunit gpT-like protein
VQITNNSLNGLYTAFNTIFNQALEGVQPTWNRVAMEVPSTTRENDYRWMKKLPQVREWLGDRVVANLEAEGYKILNKDWEHTIGVDRNDIEDDQFGIYNPLFAEQGRAVGEHPDTLIWGLLAAGFTTACYDGQNFFDTDHPVLDADGVEQSVSNMTAGAATPWFLLDTSRAIRPLILQMRKRPQFVRKDRPDDDNVFHRKEFLYGVDGRWNAGYGLWQLAHGSKADLTVANFMAARAAMQGMKGDYDRPLRVRPTLLVVPPPLEQKALEVLKAERDAAGATNIAMGLSELHVEQLLAA